jgi:hypothetical protein
MGFDGEAKELADQEHLSGCNIESFRSAGNVVQRVFAKSNLEWVKLFPHACNLQQVTAQDSSWPICFIIQTIDGIYGTHAVTTWKGMIFLFQLSFCATLVSDVLRLVQRSRLFLHRL